MPAARAQPDLPDGFVHEDVATGPFATPVTGFAFLPDGRVLVVEKSGNVHVGPTNSTTTTIIATIPDVTTELERGLLGVAVDPQWPTRPYVYFHSTQVDSVIHITLYTATGDLSDPLSTNLTLGDPYVLLDDIPDWASTHNGGTLRFGPDGDLYASIGDDVRACHAQDLATPRGKILRLDVGNVPGAGSGPPPKADLVDQDHPFSGGDWQELVFAFGLRNPFRFTIDPATGNLYIGDVGEVTWEEINELVQQGYSGDNYGWPEFEGILQDPLPFAADCSTPPFVAPIHLYPNPGTGPASIVCGPRYRTDGSDTRPYPNVYDGSLFFADFYGGWIRRLEFDTAWSLADSVAGQPDVDHWATGLGQITDLQQGPDGSLHYALYSSSRGVYRIVNTLPSDAFDASPPKHGPLWIEPNPAQGPVHVRLTLDDIASGASGGIVTVYDAAGRSVRSLRGAGDSIVWDGRSQAGVRVGAGLYLVEYRSASGSRHRGKVILLR